MRFASLERENIAYLVQDYDVLQKRLGCVEWGREYRTYGDGLTQHDYESGIAKENLADFLASLAIYLLDRPEEAEEIQKRWPYRYALNRPLVQFLHSVRPKDGKTLYFSKDTCKVSSSDSKKYDKRWEKVPEWADGTAGAVYRLAVSSYDRSILEAFAIYEYIYQIISELPENPWTGDNVCKWFDLPEQTQGAFRAVENLVQSIELKKHAERIVDGYKYNMSVRARRKEEEQAA